MEIGNQPKLLLDCDELVFSFPSISRMAKLRISFHRTLRVPDDGTDYPLPAGLGRFPLRRVADSSLPDPWQRRGGVYLPMYSNEAMWIGLESELPVAVKIASGKVNAVSGAAWSEDLGLTPQDYVVAGKQPWIDGFNVGGGCVRQFVATRLGEQRSVEEQITGGAEWGGVQLLAFPMKAEAWRAYRRKRVRGLSRVPIKASAAPMGLGFGGLIRQSIERDPWGIDAWDMSQRLRVFVHLLHATDYSTLTGESAPPTPITPALYGQHNLPWFEVVSETDGVAPTNGLAGVAPVSETLAKDGVIQMGNEPISVSNVIALHPRRARS